MVGRVCRCARGGVVVRRAVAVLAAFLVCGAWWSGAAAQTRPEPNADVDSAAASADVGGTAAEAAETERFEDEVVVTATREERSLSKLPVSVSVIDREEVETTPALHLDDLLRTVVGVNLPLGDSTTGHPASHLLSMRGLAGSRALALVDGIPLNDPFFGYIQWGKVPVENVERVEVARGGASSLFGSYALGGTINILTRPVRERDFAASALYGGNETARINMSGAVPLDERWSIGADVNYADTEGYILSPPDERGDIDTPASREAVNAQLRADLQTPQGWHGFVRANLFSEDAQFGTELATQSRQFIDLAARLKRPTADGGAVTATLFLQDGVMDTDNTDLVEGAGRDAEYVSNVHETLARDIGGSLQWSRPLGLKVPLFLVGLDARRTDGENRAQMYDVTGEPTEHLTSRGEQLSLGLYSEASFFPVDELEVLVSARLDRWSNRDGSDLTGLGELTEYPDRDFTELNPRVSLRYQLAERSGLRGSAYTAFRAPNLNELYRTFASQNLVVLPNSQLEPEFLDGVEMGYEYRGASVRGQLTVFHNEVDDLVARTVVGFAPKLTLQQVNLGRTRSRGVEAMIGGGAGSDWSWNVGYAYTDAEILEDPDHPEREGNSVPDTPGDVLTCELRYHGEARLGLSVRGRYLGGRYLDTTNTLRLGSHAVVDVHATYRLGSSLQGVLIITNLLDEEYVANTRAWDKLGAPRQVFAGLRWRSVSLD